MMLIHFLKMELYRLVKMKSPYVGVIIMAVVVFLYSFFMLGFDLEEFAFSLGGDQPNETYIYEEEDLDVFSGMEDDGTGVTVSDTGSGSSGIRFVGEGLYYHNNVAQTYALNIQGLIGLLLISIVAGLFFGNDYSTHINKNFPLINGCKWIGFTSKVLAMMIFVMAFHISIWLCCFLSHLLWAESADPGIYPASVVYFFVSYMVTVTIVTMIGFVTTLFKSKAAGVTFGVLVSIGTLSLPIRIADYIIQMRYNVTDFSLGNYIPSRILANMSVDTDSKIVIIGAICAIIYFVSAFFGSILLSGRRDLDT